MQLSQAMLQVSSMGHILQGPWCRTKSILQNSRNASNRIMAAIDTVTTATAMSGLNNATAAVPTKTTEIGGQGKTEGKKEIYPFQRNDAERQR
jgi:hypothetical protein